MESKPPREAWSDPVRLDRSELPAFPLDALPPRIALWVEATATATQTPPDLAAGMGLCVLSTAGLHAAVIECAKGWTEELAFWAICSLPSGERKSAVLREALEPLRRYERELLEHERPRLANAKAQREALEAKRKALVRQVAEDKAEPEELAAVAEELDALGEPVAPRLLADDATPEALAGLLARHGSIGIIAAESAFLDNLAGRYSEGRANLHLACQAYSGEPTRIDRRGRDPEHLDRPLLTLGLAIQPHVLARVTADQTMRDQGLLARAAFLLPTTRLGRREVNPPPIPDSVSAGYADAVFRIATLRHADRTDTTPRNGVRGGSSVGSVGSVAGVALKLSTGARDEFQAMRAAHEPRLDPGQGDLAAIAARANRHPARVARLAGLLHLAEHTPDAAVSGDTMRAAIRIADYLIPHALAAFTRTADHAELRRVLAWLRDRRLPTVTVRELHRGPVGGGHGSADEAKDVADRLSSLGYLRAVPPPPRGPKGGQPPSPKYEIHPAVFAEESEAPHESVPPTGTEPPPASLNGNGALMEASAEEDAEAERILSKFGEGADA